MVGEMICVFIAENHGKSFSGFYQLSYPVEKVPLADSYSEDDEASMWDNNISYFNYCPIERSDSMPCHSYAMVVDVNSSYNPYNMVSTDVVLPTIAGEYVGRGMSTPYAIVSHDSCYQLSAQKGFVWDRDRIGLKYY